MILAGVALVFSWVAVVGMWVSWFRMRRAVRRLMV